MIRVPPPPEPPGFDEHVRSRGRAWLNDEVYGSVRRRKSDAESYWTKWSTCAEALWEGFSRRCGYLASHIHQHQGNVEHFVSWAECQARGEHELAYEWSNFRWADARINTRKAKLDKRAKRGSALRLLDPFEVEDDWFELDLVRLVLHVTDRVPDDMRGRVEDTLRELGLRDGNIALACRELALARYRSGMSLRQLEQEDPLVARAIRRLLDPERELTQAELELRDSLQRDRMAAREQE